MGFAGADGPDEGLVSRPSFPVRIARDESGRGGVVPTPHPMMALLRIRMHTAAAGAAVPEMVVCLPPLSWRSRWFESFLTYVPGLCAAL
jgi:hypothetical protein